MKKIILLFVILCSSHIEAIDWNSKGLTVVDKQEKEGITEILLKNEKNTQFLFSYTTEPDDAKIQDAIRLHNNFREWKNLQIDAIKFFYEQGGFEISIIPKSFTYEGIDLTKYMPSGMQFTFSYILQYNFRLNIDRLFIRIMGDFESEDALCKKILSALQNPKEFIKKREAEYLLLKIESLESKYQQLADEFHKLRAATLMLHNAGFFSRPTPISTETIERVISLRLKDPTITRNKIAEELEKEKIDASSREIDLILKVYFNDFNK
ncbi:MAG: helix-turn-helix domain-containing protein [Spirochaetes bacterium]|nr:helix-turn-helix domain-containing protein [Spirochaetota bacterium]